ncbi:flavin reductase family protein [Tumidithrix elongata RA019]|uniref:Flavin reductase family protein n=1 Tax=Tumidithrix elongata BACA0141 TaxID=2716417 RepID=A0AAW9PS03_9CYAN|nr:flavin reductase family protein [Tumidithrix elongata RA019]
MHIDPDSNLPSDNYKLLTNLVIPRPIAWVTSQNAQGVVNLAPFSFFNAVGSNPLYLIISIADRDDGGLKDTASNISSSGEFVVNLVTEELLPAMNISAANFPSDESEVTAAGLHMAESKKIEVPRIAEAQASLECTLHSQQALGVCTLFVGQVVMFHVADRLIGDRFHINGFAPIGRLGSPSVYCRTSDRFDLPRISHDQWQKGNL